MKTYRWQSLFSSRLLRAAHCKLPTANFLLAIIFCLQLSSCKQLAVYEKDTAIPKYEWQSNFLVRGSFIISDTLSDYNLYVVLRHTDAYKYNNIWLNIGRQFPSDSFQYQKVNISLGEDASGWKGSGMNDIWEVRTLLTEKPWHLKQGVYNFSVSQIMRDNPLLHIMSVGMRVEKTAGE